MGRHHKLLIATIAAGLLLPAAALADDDPKALECDAIARTYHQALKEIRYLEANPAPPAVDYGPVRNTLLFPIVALRQLDGVGHLHTIDAYRDQAEEMRARAKRKGCPEPS